MIVTLFVSVSKPLSFPGEFETIRSSFFSFNFFFAFFNSFSVSSANPTIFVFSFFIEEIISGFSINFNSPTPAAFLILFAFTEAGRKSETAADIINKSFLSISFLIALSISTAERTRFSFISG